MNVIKKYWDSVYIYVLLLVPGMCMCAGTFWTICKMNGLYQELNWIQIIIFDFSQIVYLSIGLFFIYKNKKNSSYISEHLVYVKGFIVFSLFVQYNFIMYLFPSDFVWECTVLFFGLIAFLFDSKLLLMNVILYFFSLLIAHILKPEEFFLLNTPNIVEVIAWRIMIFFLMSLCILAIVYFVEKFLIEAQERDEENIRLIEKQLEYYKDMELLDTEIRKFRHDITNHFMCMEAMLHYGKTDELQKYFQELQAEFSIQKKMYFSGNDVVDVILNHDLIYNCQKELNVTVYGTLPEIKTVSAIDLCTLFSNLLSNAIKAANQCAGKMKPELIIHFAGGNTYFSIKISNSTLMKSDIKENTKKDRNHGYGINKIKNVLDKYDGRFEQSLEEQMMHITIYLPI